MTPWHVPIAVKAYPLIAGGVSVIAAQLISADFIRSLIIAFVTGLLAGGGAIVGAVWAARVGKELSEPIARDVEHVKKALGANRRSTDEHEDGR